MIIRPTVKDLGGFAVRRVLPTVSRRMVGPFVFFDHMGPVELEVGQGMDVRPHPHIGLSTLTYLFDGEIIHRDSLGVEQAIRPGAVNWMTAGRGVVHSERSSREARTRRQKIEGLQTWVALPKSEEDCAPSFVHFTEQQIPEFSWQGHRVRLVAGNLAGHRSPVPILSEGIYLDLHLAAGQKLNLEELPGEWALYGIDQPFEADGEWVQPGELWLRESAEVSSFQGPVVVSASHPSRVVVLGGAHLPERRHVWWNFVSTEKEKIEVAKLAWTRQELGRVPGETEWIPLPTS